MTAWYDPLLLFAVAIRVAISTVFGEFYDRRETLATARPIDAAALDPAYDYSTRAPNSKFWFDFVADVGDGWNPTYAIARLLAQTEIRPQGLTEFLKRGQLLMMGGDEVYPTASRDDYQVKLVAPYDQAALGNISGHEALPDLYAVPGNHDWYDGLRSFLSVFCRRRAAGTWTTARPGRGFGGRITQQTRSYFALKLPRDYWIWGVDIQLSGYIDQPQIDFFEHVAKQWMEPGSRLILCTGQPSWAYVNPENPDPQFRNFSYLQGTIDRAQRHHRLCAVLTGDSHHYSRYIEGDCNYITAGGGGAFLHPTHQLRDKDFNWDYPQPGAPLVHGVTSYPRRFHIANKAGTNEPALFPDPSTSHRLAYGNIVFAALNWQYTAAVGFIYGLFTWMLQSQARYLGSTLTDFLAPANLPFAGTVSAYLSLFLASPFPSVLVLLGAVGYCYLADYPSYWRVIVGALHAAVQSIVIVLATCVLARLLAGFPDACAIIATGIVGGVLSATTLGLYFLLSLNVFGRHWNEAFSALRIENHKCFLRMCIEPDGTLKIYPIGLRRVPSDRSDPPQNPTLTPHLIEQPIVIS